MTVNIEALTGLIREVRTCFNQLRSLSEQLIEDLGINPSMRAVMESLSANVPRTVPELAQERGTSRQHVQKVINALLDQGLVHSQKNPEHKRSVHYLMTEKGAAVFKEIRMREASPMAALSEAFEAKELTGSVDVLSRMNEELKHLINIGE